MPGLRIASLCPSNTEIVHCLGLSESLVGVDQYSDYPTDVVARLPKLGPDLHIDIDRLVQLRPDLTLCSLSVPGMEAVVEQVANAGLNHLVLSPNGFSDIWQDMWMVAQAAAPHVNLPRARQQIDNLRRRVETIAEQTARMSHRPKLYWEWWPNPIVSPAGDNWLSELSVYAGAENIFAAEHGHQVQDDGRRVLAAEPDWVLAVWTGIPQHKVPVHKLLHRSGWDTIPAFRTGQVLILSEGLYCRPSPRLVDGLEQLTSILHPALRHALALRPPEHYAPIRYGSGAWRH
ncbi:ABC transporter substrate-binding protein [Alicyclobacillus contaminans]|uniref:ABC transporter substrate-binding protein n=1 Tax=Alicyclobacillus contaminans TaxID=392016 RepID=UPI000686C603|nr:ABC transporter substrate-binding protein [Alicyclobacillus contaminans]